MNIAIVALTKGGATTAIKLCQQLPGLVLGEERVGGNVIVSVQVFLPVGLNDSEETVGIEYYSIPTPELIRKIFTAYQGIILVMATGIAVRSLAPLLRSKTSDPGVVVVDERGQFAISLLSGHLGGANDLARTVAGVLDGTPVITTSTDVQGRLAVDLLARDLGVKLEPVELLKRVNALIANGKKVLLLSEHPVNLPLDHPLWRGDYWRVLVSPGIRDELIQDENIEVILTSKVLERQALFLRPPSIVVGVGCRKGTSGEEIYAAIMEAIKLAKRSTLSVKKLVSIEAKAAETGIHLAAERLGVPTEFYSVEKLQEIMQQTEGLAQSEFVNKQMGVKGVCEPASIAGCRQGKIILGKQANKGITVALAEERFGW